MIRAFRTHAFGFVVLAAVVAAPQVPVNAAGPRVVHHRARLDARLRAVQDQTAPKPERVIIRVRPGSRLDRAGDADRPRRSDPDRARFVRCVDGGRSRRGSRSPRQQRISCCRCRPMRSSRRRTGGLLGRGVVKPRRRRRERALPNGRHDRAAGCARPSAPDARTERQPVDGSRRRRCRHRLGPRDVAGVLRAGHRLLRLHDRQHRRLVSGTTTTGTGRTSPEPSADRARCHPIETIGASRQR